MNRNSLTSLWLAVAVFVAACSGNPNPNPEAPAPEPTQTPDQAELEAQQAEQEAHQKCVADVEKFNAQQATAKAEAEAKRSRFESLVAQITDIIGGNSVFATRRLPEAYYFGGWREAIDPAACNDEEWSVALRERSEHFREQLDYSGTDVELLASFLIFGRLPWDVYGQDHAAVMVRDVITTAGTNPRAIATAGTMLRKVLPVLSRAERDELAQNLLVFLEGDSPEHEFNSGPTVEAVRADAMHFRNWQAHLDEVNTWNECTQSEATDCGDRPETDLEQYYGGGGVYSIIVRRWLQAEQRGTDGNFVVWAYRVWAVVLLGDLGIQPTAAAYAEEALAEAKLVKPEFGHKTYLDYLKRVVASREAGLVSEEGLQEALSDQ